MLSKLKECGTAFSRRLAIQFSKTEHRPSIREDSLEPSLDHRGVARTAGCVKEGGVTANVAQTRPEKVPGRDPERLQTRGRPYLPQSPSPVNPFADFRRLRDHARGQLLSPSPGSRQAAARPFACWPSPAEGAASTLPAGGRSRENRSDFEGDERPAPAGDISLLGPAAHLRHTPPAGLGDPRGPGVHGTTAPGALVGGHGV
jgi:hypothetical protein